MSLIAPVGPQDETAGAPPAVAEIIATPLGWLAHLASESDISAIERDAGEIIHRIGRHVLSDLPTTATVQYPWRDAAGNWSTRSETKSAATDRYNAAIEAAGSDRRRQAVVAALVAREPALDVLNAAAFSSGLEAIAAHFWGKATVATIKRRGVSLREIVMDKTPAAANDNRPTAERAKFGDVVETADGVRMRDSFERLLQRGVIDEDKETAVALYAAGVRYQTDHQLAQMVNFGSFDYSKPIVDGGTDALPITERVQEARTTLRRARTAMGTRCADVVDAVTLHGFTLAAAGRRYCGYRDTAQATASAKERMNVGLRSLAIFYGVAVRRG
jgi:hypothetical protein